MSESLRDRAAKSPLTWDPVKGGRRAFICWDDDKTYDLGEDPDGHRFSEIADRMLTGRYYPPDAVIFSGQFRDEKREFRVGDRVVQQAPLFGGLGGPLLASGAMIYKAERTENMCTIGYVTTEMHLGRGIWTAELSRREGKLSLHVWSTAMPGSFLFWMGLPYARFLQLRARRRAIEEFLKIY